MKRLFFAGFAMLCLAACKPGIPEDVLKPEKMQVILYDIHIADGVVANIPTQDSARKVGAAYYKGIYRKFGTDSAAYARSLDYYYKNPVKFARIYEAVVKQLDNTKKRLEKQDLEKKKKEKINAIPL